VGWQIALPSALHSGQFDPIFEWPLSKKSSPL
jgi:hypothetical protein